MHNVDDDDEIICGCGLCRTTNLIFYFAINNYVKFIIISSIIQLVCGLNYCDNFIYVFGYMNLIYITRQLNYKLLAFVMSLILLPIYFYTFTCQNYYQPNVFLRFVLNVCAMLQIIGAGIKAVVYFNRIASVME